MAHAHTDVETTTTVCAAKTPAGTARTDDNVSVLVIRE
jgi:hypothetical protein